MKAMKVLVWILISTFVVPCFADIPTDPEWVVYLPGGYDYPCGGWYPLILQTEPGGVWVFSMFHDHATGEGFKFSILNYNGIVHGLKPVSKWPWVPCHGLTLVYYKNGFSSGSGYMPPKPFFSDGIHAVTLLSDWWDGTLPQWMLQTDKTWTEPYGKYKNSTIAANGCCLVCYCMQLSRWGCATNPNELCRYLHTQKDGWGGASGLLVNQDAVVRYATKVRGMPMRKYRCMNLDEVLERGGTVQSHCNTRGHWCEVYGHIEDKAVHAINDPMGKTTSDAFGQYGGMSLTNTRSIWPDAGQFFIPVMTDGASMSAAMPRQFTYAAKPIVEANIASMIGKRPMCLIMADYEASKNAAKGLSFASLSESDPDQTGAVQGGYLLDKNSVVVWGESGLVAFPDQGDGISLILKKTSGETVATSEIELLCNDETNVDVPEVMLEVSPLPADNYVLEIHGQANTHYRVQSWEYDHEANLTDKTYEGIMPQSGVACVAFSHVAAAFLNDEAGLDVLPEGTFVYEETMPVTVKLSSGLYAVQSRYKGVFPGRLVWSGELSQFTYYSVWGTVDANHRLVAQKVCLPTYGSGLTGTVSLPTVFRNQRDLYDPIAGYLYTRITGRITKLVDANTIELDNSVIVKNDDTSWTTVGMTVIANGVAVENEFVSRTLEEVRKD